MRNILRILLMMLFSVSAISVFAQKKTSITVADIREIILETGDGFCFDCERETTLRANDARATYHGGKRSRFRSGDFSGELAAKDFTRLAQSFIENGFFDLEPLYKGTTSDVATVKITVVSKNGSKTVENFKRSDEPRFKKVETAFNATADKIVWQSASEIEKEKTAFAHLSAAHAATVKSYIGTRKGLRPALESDCENADGLAVQREAFGAKYHPFYAVWDFDKDNIEDFAVVLFDEKAKPSARFSMIVFKGAADKTFKLAFTILKIDLSSGGIELDELEEGVVELRLVHFQTEQSCTVLHWHNRRFVLGECAPEKD